MTLKGLVKTPNDFDIVKSKDGAQTRIPVDGWEITNQSDGKPPRPAVVQKNETTSCVKCKRLGYAGWDRFGRNFGRLKYGSGAGKLGIDASDEELRDCIKNRLMKGDYNSVWNNCRHWAQGAVDDCGLWCGSVNRHTGD